MILWLHDTKNNGNTINTNDLIKEVQTMKFYNLQYKVTHKPKEISNVITVSIEKLHLSDRLIF